MKIYGLAKMTLLDYPGKVACCVFLKGCDYRCPFCHNFELVTGDSQAIMEDDEFFAFLAKRHGLLDGVAITGGEPLLTAGLDVFLRRIREEGFLVKLDTNGYHPDRLKALIDEGLVDYVAMDIKNSPGRYPATCGLESMDMDRIRESIDILMKSDTDYEFRTTVVKGYHEEADFEEIGMMIQGAKRYFLQGFVDRDTVPVRGLEAPAESELLRFRDIMARYVDDASIRG